MGYKKELTTKYNNEKSPKTPSGAMNLNKFGSFRKRLAKQLSRYFNFQSIPLYRSNTANKSQNQK